MLLLLGAADPLCSPVPVQLLPRCPCAAGTSAVLAQSTEMGSGLEALRFCAGARLSQGQWREATPASVPSP